MNVRALLGMALGIALLFTSAITAPPPLVIWNASASVPIGLYAVAHASLRMADPALARLPPKVAALAARRGYLPRSAYLLKPIAAIAGDQVCRHGAHIRINGRLAVLGRLADRLGRPLPVWRGCRTLDADEVFLLADDPDSFRPESAVGLGRSSRSPGSD